MGHGDDLAPGLAQFSNRQRRSRIHAGHALPDDLHGLLDDPLDRRQHLVVIDRTRRRRGLDAPAQTAHLRIVDPGLDPQPPVARLGRPRASEFGADQSRDTLRRSGYRSEPGISRQRLQESAAPLCASGGCHYGIGAAIALPNPVGLRDVALKRLAPDLDELPAVSHGPPREKASTGYQSNRDDQRRPYAEDQINPHDYFHP